MAIEDGEWQSIQRLVERSFNKRGEPFVIGHVIKRDQGRKVVWVDNISLERPIPVLGHDYLVKYYDETPNLVLTTAVGTFANYRVVVKKVLAEFQVPEVGDQVLVAKVMNQPRLAFCLGRVVSTGWLEMITLPGEDE